MVDEVLLVGLSDVGEHAYGRTNHVLQGHHLIGFGDARLKDSKLVAFVHLPH